MAMDVTDRDEPGWYVHQRSALYTLNATDYVDEEKIHTSSVSIHRLNLAN